MLQKGLPKAEYMSTWRLDDKKLTGTHIERERRVEIKLTGDATRLYKLRRSMMPGNDMHINTRGMHTGIYTSHCFPPQPRQAERHQPPEGKKLPVCNTKEKKY